MEFNVVEPDPALLPCPMKKFSFVTDETMVSFIVKDTFSEAILRKSLNDVPENDVNKIVDVVRSHYSEEEIGETELSEVAIMAKVQCFLPS